jgi:hypothetical protein
MPARQDPPSLRFGGHRTGPPGGGYGEKLAAMGALPLRATQLATTPIKKGGQISKIPAPRGRSMFPNLLRELTLDL